MFAAAVNPSPARPLAIKFTPRPLALATPPPALAPPSTIPRLNFALKLGALAASCEIAAQPPCTGKPQPPEALPYQPAKPALISSKLNLAGEPLADLAIGAIQASFHHQPPVHLLPAPEEIPMPPAPAAAEFILSPKPKLVPVALESVRRSTLTIGPQAPPLAGPCLPPQLRNFLEHQNSNASRRRKSKGIPTWVLSLAVASILILGCGTLLQYLSSDGDVKASTQATSTKATFTQVTRPKPSPRSQSVLEEHPAARSIEVAGIRIVTAANKKLQLQYLVINHSALDVTGLNIRIAMRSVDALSDAPLASVSTIVQTLGPGQSKEIRTDLDPSVNPASIPDWQSLRPEILIARQ
jgi:hypothetical protein